MTDVKPDLSQIRGDYFFHLNFVANAVTQTLKRAEKYSAEIGSGYDLAGANECLGRQREIWDQLLAAPEGEFVYKPDSPLVQDFIDVSRSTKTLCDELEIKNDQSGSSSGYNTPLEHFTEACRQLRGMCDDMEMMREQKP